jgi:hypothetical protein
MLVDVVYAHKDKKKECKLTERKKRNYEEEIIIYAMACCVLCSYVYLNYT